jgi:hypothetical protein
MREFWFFAIHILFANIYLRRFAFTNTSNPGLKPGPQATTQPHPNPTRFRPGVQPQLSGTGKLNPAGFSLIPAPASSSMPIRRRQGRVPAGPDQIRGRRHAEGLRPISEGTTP